MKAGRGASVVWGKLCFWNFDTITLCTPQSNFESTTSHLERWLKQIWHTIYFSEIPIGLFDDKIMTTFEGRPVSLVFEPSSREFNYTYRPDPAISLPTEAKKTYIHRRQPQRSLWPRSYLSEATSQRVLNHRGPSFLAVVWFGSSHTPRPPFPLAHYLPFLVFMCVAGRAHWRKRREGGREGVKSQDGEKAWSSIDNSI